MYLDTLLLIQGIDTSRDQAGQVISFSQTKSPALSVTAYKDCTVDGQEGRVEFAEMDGRDGDGRLTEGLDAVRRIFALICWMT